MGVVVWVFEPFLGVMNLVPRLLSDDGAALPEGYECGDGSPSVQRLRKLDAVTGQQLAVGSPALVVDDLGPLGNCSMVAARHGVWVTLYHSMWIHRFDAETGDPICSIMAARDGWHLLNLCADSDAAFVTSQTIVRIDGDTGVVTRGKEEASYREGLAVFGGRLAALRGMHLDIIHGETLETIDEIAFERYPLAVSASRQAFWVSTDSEVWRVTPDGVRDLVHRSPDFVRVLPGSDPPLIEAREGLLEIGANSQLTVHSYPLGWPSPAPDDVAYQDALFKPDHLRRLVRWVPATNEVTVLFQLKPIGHLIAVGHDRASLTLLAP